MTSLVLQEGNLDRDLSQQLLLHGMLTCSSNDAVSNSQQEMYFPLHLLISEPDL